MIIINESVLRSKMNGYLNIFKNEIRSFEEVGGHPNQWFVDKQTKEGCIKKATTYQEAAFYWWANALNKQPSIPLTILSEKENYSKGEVLECAERFKESVPFCPLESIPMLEKLSQLIPLCKSLGLPLQHTEGRAYSVEMENLLLKFKHPCVMDIKMGTRMHGDNASSEKRERMIRKSLSSTSYLHGVRLTAWKIWNTNSQQYEIMTREKASELVSLSGFQHAFERYLNAVEKRYRKKLALLFQEKIQTLILWFSQQRIANFYSSSLLFLYDADSPLTPEIRMIDFAHVSFNPPVIDEGYLHGLSTLLDLLSTYIQCDD